MLIEPLEHFLTESALRRVLPKMPPAVFTRGGANAATVRREKKAVPLLAYRTMPEIKRAVEPLPLETLIYDILHIVTSLRGE